MHDSSPFELARAVRESDLDDRAHVNNVVYVRWVQDAAAAHWAVLAPERSRDDLAWVALRHEIDYHSPAVLGDEVTVRTWVGVAHGLSFERFTEIRRTDDGRLLASARTLWCPVDARTGKPQRVSAEVRARCSVPASDGDRYG
ncbi:MAG TPA: thioesterase family protein [Gemmatimonadaceae bacterium]|jgi:acyl-CoA thioester hydrolase